MSSSVDEDNVYENQENVFEENIDSDIHKLNDLIGNLHPYCYEENVSPKIVEINRTGYKDWYICECCKMKIREIDCFCCQEVAAISEENLEGNQCITNVKAVPDTLHRKTCVKKCFG